MILQNPLNTNTASSPANHGLNSGEIERQHAADPRRVKHRENIGIYSHVSCTLPGPYPHVTHTNSG